jgi:hypothetical protein
MKRLTSYLLILIFCILPTYLEAQKNNHKRKFTKGSQAHISSKKDKSLKFKNKEMSRAGGRFRAHSLSSNKPNLKEFKLIHSREAKQNVKTYKRKSKRKKGRSSSAFN